jgi:hypothetical protein
MRRTSRWMVLTAFAGLAVAAPAAAQEVDRFSLVIGGHAHAGVLIPLTKSISLRPDLQLRRSSFSTAAIASTQTLAVVGLATLHYLSREDRLRTYLSPRLATQFRQRDPDDDTETDYLLVSLSYGVNGAVTDRLGVFAEAGPQLAYSESTNPAFPPKVITRDLAVVGVIGVTFRF